MKYTIKQQWSIVVIFITSSTQWITWFSFWIFSILYGCENAIDAFFFILFFSFWIVFNELNGFEEEDDEEGIDIFDVFDKEDELVDICWVEVENDWFIDPEVDTPFLLPNTIFVLDWDCNLIFDLISYKYYIIW